MLNIIKEKLDLSPDLKKKIDWAKNYTSTSIKLEKGHLIRLEPSNLAYVDPHKVIINDYTFLFFNGVDIFYIQKNRNYGRNTTIIIHNYGHQKKQIFNLLFLLSHIHIILCNSYISLITHYEFLHMQYYHFA